MRMLFSEEPRRRRRPGVVALSVAAHAALVTGFALVALHWNRVRPVYRESRCCATGVSVEAGALRAAVVRADWPAREPEPQRPARIRIPTRRTPKPERPPQPTLRAALPPGPAAATLGTGAGDADAEPAFPVYFPRPAVADRSLLPAVERKIIVDVSISPLGDVTDEKLVQGMGNSLDQIVLATVKTWRFQPATLNGTAVASGEQLVFPFNREYGSGDGGAV